ncbi:MAG: hypothetical protein ABR576_03120 [Thermoanaerobaculia bacterium]
MAFRDGRPVLWPVAGGDGIPVPGLADGELPIQFTPDDKALYVIRPGEEPAKVWLVDRASGNRRLWREIRSTDPHAQIVSLILTPDGGAYAYGMFRTLSTAYVVDGLR